MELTLEQYNILFGPKNTSSRSAGPKPNVMRNLWNENVIGETHRKKKCAPGWKCVGVPYTLTTGNPTNNPPSFSYQQSAHIETAMEMIERHTCIRYFCMKNTFLISFPNRLMQFSTQQ